MSGTDIRKKINENNERIQFLLNKFVLTEELNELMEDNEKMREECKHEFVDGACIYCDVLEEFVNG